MRRAPSLITRIGRAEGAARARAAASVINRTDRVNYLPGQSYDVGVTRLDRQPFGPAPGRDSQPRTGPITSTEIPFQLTPNQVKVLASQDPARTGVMLQNADPVNNLFYSFGRLADATSKFLTPGMVLLRDFNTPTDRISVFATVALSGILTVEAPSG